MVSVQRFCNLEDIPQESETHTLEADGTWPN
jgi:hypothetical protein